MNLIQTIANWWRESLRKRRIVIQHASSGEEEGHIHLSPAGLLSASCALILFLFVVILILVAYTPVLEFLPGYRTEATRSRESLVDNIMRLDSMERVMNDMLTYNENIALVLEGRSPVVRSRIESDSLKLDKRIVAPNGADSMLRAQMEGEGAYSLGGGAASRRSVREAIEMITPVEGIITRRYDAREQVLGVRLATEPEAEVAAVEGGTVIQSMWTPDAGQVILIQHNANLLSVYRNLGRSNVTAGQRVKAGELIGVTSDNSREGSKPFEFELWSNGKAVDPEAYIIF